MPEIYSFGSFTLNATGRQLLQKTHAVPIPPKTLDVLIALIRNAGQLMTTGKLLRLVWSGAFIEDGIVAVHVSALRKMFGPDGRAFIETVPRSGYRFAAPVTRLTSARPKPQSIAVLPPGPCRVDDLSAQAFIDALTDRLGDYCLIVVRPPRASRAVTNSTTDPVSVGLMLGADAVVDSQLVSGPNEVRASVRLMDCGAGSLLWDVEIQATATELSSAGYEAADSLGVFLGSNASRQLARAAKNSSVYEVFGRGRSSLLSGSMGEVPHAIVAFESAVALDPTFANAHAGLALACCAMAEFRLEPPLRAYQKAKASALRALAMDEACGSAQVALGAVLFLSEWDWAAAERSFERALCLNTNDTEGYLLYGRLLETMGKLREGHEMKMRALQRDPFSALVRLQVALSYWHQRRYDEVVLWAGKVLEIDPKHPHAREYLAGAYLKMGDHDQHMAESLKHAQVHGAPEIVLNELRHTYAVGGRAAVLRYALEQSASQPGAPSVTLALLYGEAGELDAAFGHLAAAIAERDPMMVQLGVGPQWDCLRADPRFDACLKQVGLAGFRFSGDPDPRPPEESGQ